MPCGPFSLLIFTQPHADSLPAAGIIDFLLGSGWRKPPLFRSKPQVNKTFGGLNGFLPTLCSYRSYLVIHGSGELPSAAFDALSNVIFDAAIFHLRGTRSTCAMSLWLTELESPSSQAMVTPLQVVPVTVPRFLSLFFQQTRSPTLRVLDWSPVIYRTVIEREVHIDAAKAKHSLEDSPSGGERTMELI